MKPPPGPMIQFGAAARPRPPRSTGLHRPQPAVTADSVRRFTPAVPASRVVPVRRSTPTLAALILAAGLAIAGAALLAPYAGAADQPAAGPAITATTDR